MKPNPSRRHFLRGAGIALTLPWMESLPAATPPGKAPVRFACVYFSNGVEPIHWWAKGQGAQMDLGPAAAPMTVPITALRAADSFAACSAVFPPICSNA